MRVDGNVLGSSLLVRELYFLVFYSLGIGPLLVYFKHLAWLF